MRRMVRQELSRQSHFNPVFQADFNPPPRPRLVRISSVGKPQICTKS